MTAWEDWRRFIKLASEASFEPSFSEKELIVNTRASIHAWLQANPPVSSTQQLSAQTESDRRNADLPGLRPGRHAVAALLQAGEALRIACEKSILCAASVLRILTGRKGTTAIKAKVLRMMNQRNGADTESSGSWHHADKKS